MRFWQHISSRFSFAKELYVWGWRWVVFVIWGLPYLAGSLYDFLLGEGFLPSTFPNLSSLLLGWNPNWFWIWLSIGALLFVIVTFEGAYRIVQRKSAGNVDKEANVASSTDLIIPRREAFANSKVVWGLWHTGNRVKQGHLLDQNSLKRILVLKPDIKSEAVRELARHSSQRPETMVTQIRDMTDAALSMKKDIRWYHNHRDTSLTIYDSNPQIINGIPKPCSQDAWIYVEHLVPQVSIDERNCTVAYNRGEQKAIFEGYFREFEYIWDSQSTTPDISETVANNAAPNDAPINKSQQLQSAISNEKEYESLLKSLTRVRTTAGVLMKLRPNEVVTDLSNGLECLIDADDSYKDLINELNNKNPYIKKHENKIALLKKLLYRGRELIRVCKREHTISKYKTEIDENSKVIIENVVNVIVAL